MRINGQVERLPPISRIRLDSEFEPNELNAVERWSNGTRWPTLGPSVPLRIVALGMSVTAGCGSSEPSHQERVALLAKRNGKATLTSCKVVGSWSRILHAELSRLLEAAMLPHQLRMSVVSRNAVGTSFFTRCTSNHLDANTDVVLMDVALNLQDRTGDLANLIHALRQAAPNAALLFVAWRGANILAKYKRNSLRFVSSPIGLNRVGGLFCAHDCGSNRAVPL